ncbi:energy transducer TonB [Bacteroides sp.]|uniref:energy transducer TonB n=1 Tax=Bacteroides sp. TaxID=29523 RepID=UPI0026378134|nr:energy transducer TonB [Bacteroides sp.]MDD3039347.1 energy transducer TonB [Bacteroides sp.]
MAKIDLTSSEWCQLIFEGKNQAYGAYKMRENSTKRHNIAMLIVLVIALVGFTIPTLVKLATPKQKEVMTEVTTLSKLEAPEVKQEEVKKVVPVAPPPQAVKSSIKFTTPKIKKDSEIDETNEIKSQEELLSTNVAISIADVKGNDEVHGADISDLKQIVVQGTPEPDNTVFEAVEQMPSFPGGNQELMAYLGKNIKYPTIAQEQGTQGRVIIQFVVERDGSITDVHVARGVDPYLDKEAIRVIKGMPKWLPGKQNGKAVRVKFTVPVLFKLQ